MESNNDLIAQLEAIPATDFEFQSRGLTEKWSAEGAGMGVIEPILRFMEQHPTLDYGIPGPLVHFIESRDQSEEARDLYAQLYIESLERKPTPHTVWLLNRLLVYAYKLRDEQLETRLLEAMKHARQHRECDAYTQGRIDDFVKAHSRRIQADSASTGGAQ